MHTSIIKAQKRLQFKNISNSQTSLIIYLLIECLCGVYYVPDIALNTIQIFTIIILKQTYEVTTIIVIPSLQMMKLKHRRFSNLPKVTHLLSDKKANSRVSRVQQEATVPSMGSFLGYTT